MPDLNPPEGDSFGQPLQGLPSHTKSASMSTSNTATNNMMEQEDADEDDPSDDIKGVDSDAAPAVQSFAAETGRRQSNFDSATARQVEEVLKSEVRFAVAHGGCDGVLTMSSLVLRRSSTA